MKDYKIVLSGNINAGKTSLVLRFLFGNFQEKSPTIGASFNNWKTKDSYGNPINIGIWDTAGSERFNSLIPLYYRCADAILYCIDSSNFEINYEILKIESFFKDISINEKRASVYLIFTKCDKLASLEADSTPQGVKKLEPQIEELLKKDEVQKFKNIFYTSAITGDGVENAFKIIKKEIVVNPPIRQKLDSLDISYYQRFKKIDCCFNI
jgi:small GTP-binding protein